MFHENHVAGAIREFEQLVYYAIDDGKGGRVAQLGEHLLCKQIPYSFPAINPH